MEGSQPSRGDTELITQEQTSDRESTSTPGAAVASDQTSSQGPEMGSMLGQRHSRLSALIARSIVGCVDSGYINCAVWLWKLPLQSGWQRFASDAMDSIVHLQGRPDVLARLVTHLMAEDDAHRPLQLITALLRYQRVEALCALCCEMAAEGHVAQVATLLADAARQDCHVELAALMLHMVREEHRETARDMAIIMLVSKREDALGMVFMHMLRCGGVSEVANLSIAIAEAGAITLACDIKRAMLRCQEACHAPVGLVCMEVIRMGRADMVARALTQLHGESCLEGVAEALGSVHSTEAVQATVQVSLALASSNRPDIMTDIKLALLECGHSDLVEKCTTTCVDMGHAWVPAALSLQLVHRGKIKMEVDIVEAVAQGGRVDLLARWMGVIIRGGHQTEFAEIAGELHKQDLFWIVADVVTQLVPAGRVGVEAHNAICNCLGPEYAADVHILMVERGHLDDICQLTATLIINNQAPLLIKVLISIVDDRDRADCVAKKQVRFLETGYDAIVAMIHNELINEGRFLEGAKLAAALADITDVVHFVERLRDAGARIMPEIWHYSTTACFRAGRVIHPNDWYLDTWPDALKEAELSLGDSQAAVQHIHGQGADDFGQSALQHAPKGEQEVLQNAPADLALLQPSTPPTRSSCIQPQMMDSPDVIGVASCGADDRQCEREIQPEQSSQPVRSAKE